MSAAAALRRALAALLAIGAASAAMPAFALTPQEVYARVSASVWKVLTYDADGLPLGQGSAVVVGDAALITNCHVLKRAKRVVVRRETLSMDARLDLWDPQRDLCQLRATGLAAPAVGLGASSRIVVGQPVYAIGNPKGLDLTMSAGLVSSLRRNDAGQLILIQTSAAISGGSSGGGLFDDQGQLVGLTTIGSVGADTQNLNFAVPADWIRELPERHAKLAAGAAGASAVPSSATVAPAAAAAPAPAASAALVPEGSRDYARIDEIERLPFASDKMRERYKLFLTKPLPRSFAISDSGAWNFAWGSKVANDPSASPDPSERALQQCSKASQGKCFLYAVDNRVVYRPAGGDAAAGR